MKFISLGTKRAHRRGNLDKPPKALPECFTEPEAMPHQSHTVSELRKQIHEDLRMQHPEWIAANGESPICDSYESRLMELLDPLTQQGSSESIAASHRAFA